MRVQQNFFLMWICACMREYYIVNLLFNSLLNNVNSDADHARNTLFIYIFICLFFMFIYLFETVLSSVLLLRCACVRVGDCLWSYTSLSCFNKESWFHICIRARTHTHTRCIFKQNMAQKFVLVWFKFNYFQFWELFQYFCILWYIFSENLRFLIKKKKS